MWNFDDQAVRGGTVCLSKAGLAVGGTSTKARTNAPNGAGIDFAIDGIIYHLADADDNIVFTAATAIADLSSILYLICVTSANVITAVPGVAVLAADIASGKYALRWPAPTQDTCPIGGIRVDTSGGTWTPATTALDAGTITDTYYDFFAVPTDPITA